MSVHGQSGGRGCARMTRRAVVASGLGAAAFVAIGRAIAATGATALSGDRFELDGVECLLDDIIAPAPRRLSMAPEPFAGRARAALQRLLDEAAPAFEATGEDRWGRPVGRLYRAADGGPLDQALIAAGAARVFPQSADHGNIRTLLGIERAARDGARGLWAIPFYAPIRANDIETWRYPQQRALSRRFHIARGALTAVAKQGGRTFFNFGEDYREDFTATWIGDARSLPILADGDDLIGRLVEARGYVSFINGPSLEIRHPLQILAPLSV
ncbi:MAG: hypothetical protein GC152_07355 [Alphaproteobacteria bacterium]|nr:hypothetical protein [Alphaproteobacteria bacterium]